jgi:hypothetical protein
MKNFDELLEESPLLTAITVSVIMVVMLSTTWLLYLIFTS